LGIKPCHALGSCHVPVGAAGSLHRPRRPSDPARRPGSPRRAHRSVPAARGHRRAKASSGTQAWESCDVTIFAPGPRLRSRALSSAPEGRGACPRDARGGAIRARNRDSDEGISVHSGSRHRSLRRPTRRSLTGGDGPSQSTSVHGHPRAVCNRSGSHDRAAGTLAA